MKIASIDLGSNTFLLLICEVHEGVITQIYHDEIKYVRLGEGLHKNSLGETVLSQESIERAKHAIGEFSEVIKSHKPDKILGMGTSALRDAKNGGELIQFGAPIGIPIEVIPGHMEAQITNSGAFSNRNLKAENGKLFLVIDIGGGSTEFILSEIKDSQITIRSSKSYDIGCVRLRKKFGLELPHRNDQIIQIEEDVKLALADFVMSHMQTLKPGAALEILAVAGTPTTIAMAEYRPQKIEEVEGKTLSIKQLQEWLFKTTTHSRASLIEKGVPEGRVDVIAVGIATLLQSLKAFKQEQLTVSTRGVRHGIALHAAKS